MNIYDAKLAIINSVKELMALEAHLDSPDVGMFTNLLTSANAKCNKSHCQLTYRLSVKILYYVTSHLKKRLQSTNDLEVAYVYQRSLQLLLLDRMYITFSIIVKV